MKQTTIRIITGIIITLIGASALMGALNIIPFWSWFGGWWPLLVVLGGILILIGDLRRNYIWGIMLLIVGGLLLFKTQGILDFNFFSLIIPIFIIAGGLSVLIHSKGGSSVDTSSNNADDVAVIFSGSETKNKSKQYEGGKVTAIFGGAVLDLRDAKLASKATLDVFALCGGIELRVPRDWKVVSKIAPIAGGVENKSEGSDDHKGPTLVLTGTVTFGGVEIKT